MNDEKNQTGQLERFKRMAKELECDESDEALDAAAAKVIKLRPPPRKEKSETEKPAD